VTAYLWIALGGALGSMARFAASNAIGQALGETFPWGTILVNVSGSFVIGLLAALTVPGGRLHAPPDLRLFLLTGVCGGYTTFSSFSLQTLDLIRNSHLLGAMSNVLLSVGVCLLAVWLGAMLGQAAHPFRTG
jgi:fluoride exporter